MKLETGDRANGLGNNKTKLTRNPAVNNETLTLIGAGLVGSLLAVLLAKRGFSIELIERQADMRKQTISAGRSINLALANRGIFPLEQAGVMGEIGPILIEMKGRMIHDLAGKQDFQRYGQKSEEVIYSVSRAALNKICLDAAEATGRVTIRFNQKCESVDFDKSTLALINEETLEKTERPFNRIIGTDGSASAVRHAIHEIESSELDILPLGHSYKELCIPAGKNGGFQLDENALHIWPRGDYMLIALPNLDHSFTVTLFLPNDGKLSFTALKTVGDVTAFFETHFKNVQNLLPNLAQDFFENPTGQLATVKCAPWHLEGKALLLGDAAHAVVPFHGQGMNCGFEDALDLARTIDQYILDSNPSDDRSEITTCHTREINWQGVFAQVDQNRKINGDAIADMAIENYTTMRDSVRDATFILRQAVAFELERRFPTRFCPRYSMVMFHRLPYSEAKERGILQEAILETLTDGASCSSDVDFEYAEKLIKQKLSVLELNPT